MHIIFTKGVLNATCVSVRTYVRTVYVTRTLRNPTNSVEILCGFRKASVQLTAELQYYFRGECLLFPPRNDTSLSADSPLPT